MNKIFNRFAVFSYFSLFWVGFNFLAIALAICGIFYETILILYLAAGISFAGLWLWKERQHITKMKPDRMFLGIVLASLALIAVLSNFSTPTIFSGRDQGSLSEAAIRLSENHQLKFSTTESREFFKIYGPGKALNFPGFSYTRDGSLITQFPIGYISWLASFDSLFGLSGLILANAVSFFIFLIAFFLLARLYLKNTSALIAYLLIISSFIFSWLFKMTLSENLALAFVWLGLLEIILYFKTKELIYLFISLATFTVLAFTRIEAFSFWIAIATLFFIKRYFRRIFFQNLYEKHRPYLIAIGIILFFHIVNIFVNWAYYLTFIKGFLGSFSTTGDAGESVSLLSPFFYVLKTFNAYALLDSLIVLGLAVFYALYKKRYSALVPLFLVLPAFIYLIHPGISLDHPWMLRRYAFAIVPIAFFYSVWFFESYLRNRLFIYIFSSVMILNNLIICLPYFSFSEDTNLLNETKVISEDFESSDLILIDQKATGSGFSMMTGPMSMLFGKRAVYFFNLEDINKLDFGKFNNVYIIIPDDNLYVYQNDFSFNSLMTFQKDYRITTEDFNILTGKKTELLENPVAIAKKEMVSTQGKIYLLKK
jgi:hypothetical protein